MNWRLYTPQDYELVSGWWKAWKWPAILPDSLPKIGVITGDGERDIAAAWLYRTDSSIALIEWHITNPRVRKSDRDGYIEKAVELLCEQARNLGYRDVLSIVRNPHLIKRLTAIGFDDSDGGTHVMTRRL